MSLAVKHLQRPLLCSVLFVRMQGKKLVNSTVILEMQATSKYYYVNCYCSAVTMPIKLSSYTTWSETIASVQLPLNSVFFCLTEVLSHVICDINVAAVLLCSQHRMRPQPAASMCYELMF